MPITTVGLRELIPDLIMAVIPSGIRAATRVEVRPGTASHHEVVVRWPLPDGQTFYCVEVLDDLALQAAAAESGTFNRALETTLASIVGNMQAASRQSLEALATRYGIAPRVPRAGLWGETGTYANQDYVDGAQNRFELIAVRGGVEAYPRETVLAEVRAELFPPETSLQRLATEYRKDQAIVDRVGGAVAAVAEIDRPTRLDRLLGESVFGD